MTQDASEVVIGADGRVYTGPLTAANLPDDVDSPIHATFDEHGFTSEDGVTFRDGKEIEDILAWQSFYPIRKVVSAKSTGVEFVLKQFNPANAELAFGGGTVDVAGGVATYVPPTPGEIDERAVIVEWEDGDYTFRLVIPKGIVTDEVESVLNRTAAADLPIAIEATPEGAPDPEDPTTYPFYILSDHPAWLAAS